MPSPEQLSSRRAPFTPLVHKELRDLALGRAFWAAVMIAVLLTGYSYIQAAHLYAEASRSAAHAPELARGLSPLDGILVPTMGALYLVVTLLYPFVVIRTVSAEKQSGALKLILQLPYPTSALLAAKLVAVVVAWAVLLLPSLIALGLWTRAGGHLDAIESANLLLGHLLYALVVAGFSLAAAAMSQSPSSAAIAALAVTLGFWVLDFAATGQEGLVKSAAGLSLTHLLRTFEQGVFALPMVLGSLFAAAGCIAVAGIWLHLGRSTTAKLKWTAIVVAVSAAAIAAASQLHVFRDATENRRNSFSASDEAALRALAGPLRIDVYLAPEDPRLYDLEQSVLGKLRRTMPNVEVVIKGDAARPVFSGGGGDDYGKIFYFYGTRQAMSRSTSEDEILPLIFGLAWVARPMPQDSADYPGYPNIADTRPATVVFYFVLPAAVLISWGVAGGALRVLGRSTNPVH
ncbi:MAG TPA: ABC transporter permease subunit [Planctomycetaceae bacterium]|nr:ABC transporter permease subunit [Planctomycetaceae bacterium]